MKWHIDPSKLVVHNKLVKSQNFYKNGKLSREIYYLNGKYHNPNGPACRVWYTNGQLYYESYYLNGKQRHNPNGPAYQAWYEDGRLNYELYCLNGIHYSKEEYDKLVK